mmetsp:Transcript_16113/g.33498  ORF Transcript_16113/g.33498 Transcript_16113/m.33498 type:complete len:430 (+) Transcript_16113:87-1376(+)
MFTEKCDELCGYAAAIAAALSYGSFGVPVKSEVAKRLDVDPLVMQSYKSIMCFLCCWLIIPMGEPVRFTPWGIVSGIFWVPGGVAGIYGIRNAGLAVAVGTWSSIIVLSSFFWGIFVFQEKVKSISGACGAVATLIIGLLGMSFFSRPPKKTQDIEKVETEISAGVDSGANDDDGIRKRLLPPSPEKDAVRGKIKKIPKARHAPKEQPPRSGNRTVLAPSSASLTPIEVEFLLNKTSSTGGISSLDLDISEKKNLITFFNGNITMTKRQVGMLAAAFNGGWGGINLVPLHFASREGFGGPGYVISFACGSMIVTISIWVLRYIYELHRLDGDFTKAFHALPSFHIRQMWLQGALSGFLHSLGNFMSIIAVTHLGQGVGYSFTQTSMLVSGLWGIFKFGEIKGRTSILKWLSAATFAVAGILWLSYEHAA